MDDFAVIIFSRYYTLNDKLSYYYFQALWFLLDKNHTPPLVGDDKMINYVAYKEVAKEAGEKCR